MRIRRTTALIVAATLVCRFAASAAKPLKVFVLAGQSNMEGHGMSLLRTSKLTAEHRTELLGGVTIIRGSGVDQGQQPCDLLAVPYYAWANRERGPMTVWINEH